MKLRDIPAAEVGRRLRTTGVCLETGPFVCRVVSPLAQIQRGLDAMYGSYRVLPPDVFADYRIEIQHGRGLRRWIRPQACYVQEGQPVFEPMPVGHAFALFEWAYNWAISTSAHQYLILHAAVVAKDNRAILLPAPPGSGKSTLCAALVLSGWRLLSDELALVSMQTGQVHPLCRPVSLKNDSIPVISAFAPGTQFSQVARDTSKGNVSHMLVPEAHVDLAHVPATVRWVVFPKYDADAATSMVEAPKATTVVELGRNAFNLTFLGSRGFERLCDLVEGSQTLRFRYSRLPEAISTFEALARDTA